MASRTYRIGYLGSAPVDSLAAPVDALMAVFLRRLQELGYAEGKNLIVEHRTTEGLNERYLTQAMELVNLKADVILAPGTAAAFAAEEGDQHGSHRHGSGWRSGWVSPYRKLRAARRQHHGHVVCGGEVTPKQLELRDRSATIAASIVEILRASISGKT